MSGSDFVFGALFGAMVIAIGVVCSGAFVSIEIEKGLERIASPDAL